jgi:hypothetical protein
MKCVVAAYLNERCTITVPREICGNVKAVVVNHEELQGPPCEFGGVCSDCDVLGIRLRAIQLSVRKAVHSLLDVYTARVPAP